MTTLQERIHLIITGFESGSLPKEEWTHEAHLIMALHYALKLDEHEILPHIRQSIIRYNEAVGTANTATSGYHETLTVFYVQAVMGFLTEHSHTQSLPILTDILLHSDIADRAYPLRFYTKEYLFSPEARATYLPPNLA